jgi:hypothetical protein
MTIKTLKALLGKYPESEDLRVNVIMGTQVVANAEILKVNTCPCCHELQLNVRVTTEGTNAQVH